MFEVRTLLLLFFILASFKTSASWAPLNLKQVVCLNHLIIYGELVEISEDKYSFSHLKKNAVATTSYRIAKIKIIKIIKNEFQSIPDPIQKFVTFLTPSLKKSTSGFDHMLIRRRVGQKGLWIFEGRNPFTGDMSLLDHPNIPLRVSRLNDIEKLIAVDCRI